MTSTTVNKVVLKSNTTMTLSDRFGDIMKMKSPPKKSVAQIRTEQTQLAQASAKNKRLAEQMARRSDLETESPAAKPDGIKSRLGAAKKLPTKARLGTINQAKTSPNRRGVNVRGGNRGSRGFSSQRRSLATTRQSGFSRGNASSSRGSGSSSRGRRASWQGSGATRGRGRGGFKRGTGRGGNTGSKATREDLDKELDSYMGVKKNHLSFDSS